MTRRRAILLYGAMGGALFAFLTWLSSRPSEAREMPGLPWPLAALLSAGLTAMVLTMAHRYARYMRGG